MSWGAWAFLLVTWGGIIAMNVFCIKRFLKRS